VLRATQGAAAVARLLRLEVAPRDTGNRFLARLARDKTAVIAAPSVDSFGARWSAAALRCHAHVDLQGVVIIRILSSSNWRWPVAQFAVIVRRESFQAASC